MLRPRTPLSELLKTAEEGQSATVSGWVRNKRVSKNVGFLELNDGSTLANLQLVFSGDGIGPAAAEPVDKGAAIQATGRLVPSRGKGQPWERAGEAVELVGGCPEDYPLQANRHSF